MGAMKRYAEEVSDDMGFGGEINEQVIAEADRRLLKAAARAREVAFTFRVFTVVGLYPSAGDGDGRFLFPVDRDGHLIVHSDMAIARAQRANYRACLHGNWKGYAVTEAGITG